MINFEKLSDQELRQLIEDANQQLDKRFDEKIQLEKEISEAIGKGRFRYTIKIFTYDNKMNHEEIVINSENGYDVSVY